MLISLNSDDGGQTTEDGQTGLLPSVRCRPSSVLCPPSPVFVSITTLAQQTPARPGNDNGGQYGSTQLYPRFHRCRGAARALRRRPLRADRQRPAALEDAQGFY